MTMNTVVFFLNPTKPTPRIAIAAQSRSDPEKKDWNGIIKRQARLKNDHAILSTYAQMESLGISIGKAALPLVFKACSRLNDVESGKRIHASIENTDLVEDVRVGTSIVDFYCKCGFLEEGRRLFDRMTEKDLVLWNAVITGCVNCGYYEEAIGLFRLMQGEGFEPNSRSLVAILLACEGILELRLGQKIHGYSLRNGYFDLYPHVGTALVGFYLNFDVRASSLVFNSMVVRSTVSWNAMINGYFDVGNLSKALEYFLQMLNDGIQLDSVTILIIIQVCGELGSLKLGMQIHQMAVKLGYSDDLFIANALLNMYSELGSLNLACKLFDTDICDVALWNSMIAAFIEYGCYEEAVNLFDRMQMAMREDERTIVTMLSLCAELDGGLETGNAFHAYACKRGMQMDNSVGNALLSMYARQNCIEAAEKVFYEISDLDVISYNTLIFALASCNLKGKAWELFGMMRESEIKPNSYTVISLLANCEDETCLNVGRSLHGFVIKQSIEINLSLNTALTGMYMNCSDESTASNMFEACPNKDVISWNAMISSYIERNQTNVALLIFNHMISQVEPNVVTIINVLSVCTDVSNLSLGQCLHAYAIRKLPFSSYKLSLANALITMYTRCGGLQNAEKIFKSLQRRNIISWNGIIAGYGANGHGYAAILAFMQMLEDGFQPNGITFLSVMSACRHAGLIEKGLEIFHSMVGDFRITPALAHYGCVVDLLGCGGYLDEARQFINSMPFEPDATVWRALLSACHVHSNIKLAAAVFEKLIELEPTNAANYILLSNIYAAAGLWSEVRQVRTQLKGKGLRKSPGTSWIIIRSQVHSFTAGDTSHPLSNKIYATLTSLLLLIRESRYATDFCLVLHDEGD